MSVTCKYCALALIDKHEEFYSCEKCSQTSHVQCMDTPKPSRLKGDFLFVYRCKDCSFERKDVLTRLRSNWVQVIHLALYNLTILERGRQGFFRWKEEICVFIDRNWSIMMSDRTKTSTWISTVAGTLSLHSPKLFRSGQNLFRESGWWALSEVTPPIFDAEMYRMYKNQTSAANNSEIKLEKLVKDGNYGRGKRHRSDKKTENTNLNKPNKITSVPTGKNTNDRDIKNTNDRGIDDDGCKVEKIPKLKIKVESNGTASPVNQCPEHSMVSEVVKSEPMDYEESWQLDEPQMDDQSFDLPESLSIDSMLSMATASGRQRLSSDSIDDPFPFFDEALSSIPSDLLEEQFTSTKTTCPVVRLDESKPNSPHDSCGGPIKIDDQKVSVVPLLANEELECLQKINSCSNVLACDSSVRRLRRKFLNRKAKRELGLPVFNLDETIRRLLRKSAPESLKFMFEETKIENRPPAKLSKANDLSYHHPALRGVSILDRFFCFQNMRTTFIPKKTSFLRLIGCAEDNYNDRPITSPYTSRLLKPYIRRDFDTLPTKLKVLNDVRQSNLQSNPRRWPIDYCYVQPKHIAAINSLCNDFFWPGIDLTECLQYPDFSCVVLYRKLLIGFAFMVPDVSYNEAYISFILVHPDWQRAGIGTNMIYHLIQTCMGKDITLHVAPTNPSMMLYQKFGFKAESLILDFYDKYLPDEQPGSRHAFLLRLQR